MRKLIVGAVILAVAVSVGGYALFNGDFQGLGARERKPAMSVSQAMIDIGTMHEGDESPEITFTIENAGNAPLRITEIKAGCPCLSPSLSREIMAPGETSLLTVIANVPATPGSWSDTISLSSNDPLNPVQKVEIKGYVEVGSLAIPQKVHLSGLERGRTQQAAFEVIGGSGDTSFQILDVSANTDAITVGRVVKVRSVDISARERWNVTFSVSYRGLSNWEDKIIVSTTDVANPRLEIPVVVNETQDFAVVPRSVFLKQTQENRAPARTVTITCGDKDRDFSIGEIRKPRWLEVTARHPEEHGPVQLRVGVVPNFAPNGAATADRVIVTLQPDEMTLEIPVMLFATGGSES
jgi:Protein of unknown function (DUF1573)